MEQPNDVVYRVWPHAPGHLFAPGAEADGVAALRSRVRMTRYGGDCYAYCLLAAGFVDLIVEAGAVMTARLLDHQHRQIGRRRRERKRGRKPHGKGAAPRQPFRDARQVDTS